MKKVPKKTKREMMELCVSLSHADSIRMDLIGKFIES